MLYIFAFLNSIYFFFFKKKKLYLFLISFFFVILIQPYFQKLTDPNMFGIHFMDINFERLKTNLLYLITFFILIVLNKKIKLIKKNIFIWISLLVVISLFNLFFAIDMERSLWMTVITIFSPLLFYILLLTFHESLYINEQEIYKVFLYISIIFFILGFFYYFAVGLKESESLYSRSGGGVYLSNYGAQISMLFFPIVMFSTFKIKYEKLLKFILSICFILALFISLGRTAFFIYFSITILIIFKYKKKNRFKIIFFIFILFSFLIFILQNYLNIDLGLLIENRLFRNNESVVNSIEHDTRFLIYTEAFQTIIKNFFSGIGLSNFRFVNIVGYSNSHNLFLNILIERGVFLLILFISFIYFILKGLDRCAKYKMKNSQIFPLLRYGIIGFLLIGLTGNDIFISSGLVNAWTIYFLVLIFTIQEKCNTFHKRRRNKND